MIAKMTDTYQKIKEAAIGLLSFVAGWFTSKL
jgi:hypothetical protein